MLFGDSTLINPNVSLFPFTRGTVTLQKIRVNGRSQLQSSRREWNSAEEVLPDPKQSIAVRKIFLHSLIPTVKSYYIHRILHVIKPFLLKRDVKSLDSIDKFMKLLSWLKFIRSRSLLIKFLLQVLFELAVWKSFIPSFFFHFFKKLKW